MAKKLWQFDDTIDSVGDFNKKYRNTLILLQHPRLKEETPSGTVFFVAGVDNHTIVGRLGVQRTTMSMGMDDLDFSLKRIVPKSGYFFSERSKAAMCISRIPARQWTKGLSQSNTSIIVNTVPRGEVAGVDAVNVSSYLRNSSDLVTIAEAVERIEKEGLYSFPLNRDFAVARGWYESVDYTLLRRGIPIGGVKGKHIILYEVPKMKIDMVHQEFFDYIKSLNMKGKEVGYAF